MWCQMAAAKSTRAAAAAAAAASKTKPKVKPSLTKATSTKKAALPVKAEEKLPAVTDTVLRMDMDVDAVPIHSASDTLECHVRQHMDSMSLLLETIDTIAESVTDPSSSTPKQTINELLNISSRHFISLKQSQRNACVTLQQHLARDLTLRRNNLESGRLQLQNLAYERAHLLREIGSCRRIGDGDLRELECMAIGEMPHAPVESDSDGVTVTTGDSGSREATIAKFLSTLTSASASASANALASKTRPQHQAILDSLTAQIESRKTSSHQLSQQLSLQRLASQSFQKQNTFLQTLPTQLQAIEDATLPLQTQFGQENAGGGGKRMMGVTSARRQRFREVAGLCRPLYVLCCQLEGHIDAFGNDAGTGNASVRVEKTGSNEEQEVVLTMRGNQTRDDTPDASASVWETSIRFRCRPAWGIVTAEAVNQPQLLVNLFPQDNGRSTPNPGAYHHHHQRPSPLEQTTTNQSARPYVWVQWLAGLCHLPDGARQERLEPSTRRVMEQLTRRARGHFVLEDLVLQLTLLASNKGVAPQTILWKNATADGKKQEGATRLVGWKKLVNKELTKEVTDEFTRLSTTNPNTADTDDDDHGRYYRATIQRTTAHNTQVLVCLVMIRPEYPVIPPTWRLQPNITLPKAAVNPKPKTAKTTSPQKPKLYDSQLKILETQLATGHDESDDVLLRQLQQLVSSWDVLAAETDVATTVAVAAPTPSPGRRVSGRERKRTAAFQS